MDLNNIMLKELQYREKRKKKKRTLCGVHRSEPRISYLSLL